jgi:uncharacterized Zn finger protein (UPF0148 family)
MSHLENDTCLRCGTLLQASRCKVQCPRCGYREDCADACLIDYDRPHSKRGPLSDEALVKARTARDTDLTDRLG